MIAKWASIKTVKYLTKLDMKDKGYDELTNNDGQNNTHFKFLFEIPKETPISLNIKLNVQQDDSGMTAFELRVACC